MTSTRATPADPAGTRPPEPEPLEVNTTLVVAIGTTLWVVALVVVLAVRGNLNPHARDWVLWMCVAGAGLGVIGVPLSASMQRRARGARRG